MRRGNNELQVAGGAAVCAVSLWFSIDGLLHGAVQGFGRDAETLSRTAQPVWFWLVESGWIVVSLLGFWHVAENVRRIRRKSPFGKVYMQAAVSRKMQAQVRSIEAGAGPEPPWVHFSGSLNSPSDDTVEEYLEKEFVPFWHPLGPEARAAYLRRNPPPNAEWQEAIEFLL